MELRRAIIVNPVLGGKLIFKIMKRVRSLVGVLQLIEGIILFGTYGVMLETQSIVSATFLFYLFFHMLTLISAVLLLTPDAK
jgi:hypothetical protein